MNERLRELERAHRADPQDLAALRALANERKRRGLELLPCLVRGDPWLEWLWRVRVELTVRAWMRAFRLEPEDQIRDQLGRLSAWAYQGPIHVEPGMIYRLDPVPDASPGEANLPE